MIRRAPFAFALVALIGCDSEGGGGCDGLLQSLEEPVPASRVFDDAASVRVTGSGMDFVNDKLPTIIDAFAATECRANPTLPTEVPCPTAPWGTCAADGLCHSANPDRAFVGIKVPPTTIDSPATCINEVRICRTDHDDTDDNSTVGDCNVFVRVDDIELTPTSSGNLDFTTSLQLWSHDIRVYIDSCIPFADFMCDINIQDATQGGFVAVGKDVTGSMIFDDANPLGRLSIDLDTINAQIVEDDVELCGFADIGLIKGLIFSFLGESINDQLETAVRSTVAGLATEDCLETPCSRPDISSCNAEDVCVFNENGEPVPALLGLEGTVDLAGLLGGFTGDASEVDFTAFAATADDKGSGLELSLTAGARAPQSDCVPTLTRPAGEVPAFIPGNNAPSGGPYHAAIGASDRLLNTIVYEAFAGGALCQTITGASIPQLSSGALALAMPSLMDLTGGRSVPLTIDVRPRQLPYLEIGRNILGDDPDDPERQILVEPLLNLIVNELDLDIFAAAGGDGALVRIATLSVDVLVDLSFAIDGSGSLQLVAGDASTWLRENRVLNMEVLREDPAELEAVIPILLAQILPALTSSLLDIAFDVPPVAGFEIGLEDVAGSTALGNTIDGNPRFAHMTIYSNLNFNAASAQSVPPIDTRGFLRSLDVPTGDGLRAGEMVRIAVDVSSPQLSSDEIPVVWHRVDNGPWHPPVPTRTLIVKDPVLHTEGVHTIEIAAARAGAPTTLDPAPLVFEVEIDAVPPTVVVSPDGDHVLVRAADTMTAPEDLVATVFIDGKEMQTLVLDTLGQARVSADSSLHEVRVDVVDEAGRTATDTIGERFAKAPIVAPAPVRVAEVLVPPAPKTQVTTQASGCSQTSVTMPFGFLALLGALALRRRRSTRGRSQTRRNG